VHFSITSASVFNSFFIPQLGSMIYAMPGMVSQLHLQADNPGQLRGISAQFSGDGFSDMDFQVKSVPAAEFGAWATSVRGASPALDQAAYIELKRQTQRVAPTSFGSVDPQLFHAIAIQTIPPAAGPEPGNPSHAGREVSTGGRR
jgi:cytochrome o ubiquinol oxidase subunit 2